jgi:hypothetical protein
MSCLPTILCFTGGSIVPSGTNCGADPCDTKLKISNLIKYVGPNLPCTGIDNCDNLTLTLQKIDEAICALQNANTTTTTSSSTSTSTSTTTTTTTACPCSVYEFIGSDSEFVTFEFVPCEANIPITITVTAVEYHCVNLAYAVTKVLGLAGSFSDTNVCCPITTTTTTTIAPECASYYIEGGIGGGSWTASDCTTGNPVGSAIAEGVIINTGCVVAGSVSATNAGVSSEYSCPTTTTTTTIA